MLPDLLLPEEETVHIGIWGQLHAKYLRQRHKVRYYNLLASGKLNRYLANIDEQAEDMFSWRIKQMAEKQGITEQLKETNQMPWIGKMNACRNAAAEIVNNELIFA